MPLNVSQRERVQQAERELAIKKKLEVKFSSELNRLFKRIGADLNNTIAETGGSISAASYSNDLSRILDRNYKRVQREFTKQILNFLRDNRNNLDENLVNALSQIAQARGTTLNKLTAQLGREVRNDLDAFREFNVIESTEVITATTQKEIDNAINKSTELLRQEVGENFTNGQLARQTRSNFLARQNFRARTIAATETQNAAEGTKQIERDSVFSIRNSNTARELDIPPIEGRDTWVTQGDSLVRAGNGTPFDHLAADGQEKRNGAFTVSGQKLRFPGDRSLGASLGNIVSCRCSAITVIE